MILVEKPQIYKGFDFVKSNILWQKNLFLLKKVILWNSQYSFQKVYFFYNLRLQSKEKKSDLSTKLNFYDKSCEFCVFVLAFGYGSH